MLDLDCGIQVSDCLEIMRLPYTHHFFKADEEGGRDGDDGQATTKDGTVDFRGRPARKARTGAWRSFWFVYSQQVFTNLAWYGCSANLVTFLTTVMHQSNSVAATNVSNWLGVGYITPLIGAFLADAYCGRYWACFVSGVIYVIGMIFLTVSASVTSLRPKQCSTEDVLCRHASTGQAAFVFFALYVVDVGAGVFQVVVTSFAADQFDEEDDDAEEKDQKSSFFTWYYQSSNIGGLLAVTIFVFIQDNVSWGVGFGAALISVAIGFLCFLAGTPFYRHHPPGGNPLGRIAQVLVASARKWRLHTPVSSGDLHEVPEEMESAIHGSRKIRHTREFRFLDKAAVKMDGDKSIMANPWKLCTITQVEEVKILVRMIPIVITSAMFSTVYNQMSTLFILQGSTMDLRMGRHFQIPPGSLTVFELLSVIVSVPIYDVIVVRFVSKITKNPRGFTELQRIGMGLCMSILAMIVAALVEIARLKVAKRHALLDNPGVPVPMSVFWLVPQYFVIGVAEVFAYVGIFEFFYGQSADAVRGLGMGFAYLTIALGSFLGSALLSIVTRVTTRNGAPGWIADNLNRGHIDYFFWLLAALSAVNFLLFVVCAKWYKTLQTWRPRKHLALNLDDHADTL